MTRRPRLTGRQIVNTLSKTGFDVVRVKGSHHVLRHPDGRTTTVPIHAGETIGPGLLSQILRDCDLTADELKKLL